MTLLGAFLFGTVIGPLAAGFGVALLLKLVIIPGLKALAGKP